MTDERLTTSEALAELKDLLRLASTDEALQRLSATRYTRCREVLLQSELRSVMPSFLRQCLTHARFHDFIHLYSHDRGERLAFVEAALKPCENRIGLRSTFDVFGDPDL